MVTAQVEQMAKEASSGPVSKDLVRSVATQALVALAATASPLAASAADAAPQVQQMQTPAAQGQQNQQGQQAVVTGRVTYSRLLELVGEGSVKRVELYDSGRTCVAVVNI